MSIIVNNETYTPEKWDVIVEKARKDDISYGRYSLTTPEQCLVSRKRDEEIERKRIIKRKEELIESRRKSLVNNERIYSQMHSYDNDPPSNPADPNISSWIKQATSNMNARFYTKGIIGIPNFLSVDYPREIVLDQKNIFNFKRGKLGSPPLYFDFDDRYKCIIVKKFPDGSYGSPHIGKILQMNGPSPDSLFYKNAKSYDDAITIYEKIKDDLERNNKNYKIIFDYYIRNLQNPGQSSDQQTLSAVQELREFVRINDPSFMATIKDPSNDDLFIEKFINNYDPKLFLIYPPFTYTINIYKDPMLSSSTREFTLDTNIYLNDEQNIEKTVVISPLDFLLFGEKNKSQEGGGKNFKRKKNKKTKKNKVHKTKKNKVHKTKKNKVNKTKKNKKNKK